MIKISDLQRCFDEIPIANEIAEILLSSLEAVDPIRTVQRSVTRKGHWLKVGGQDYSLHLYDRVNVIGVGKASIPLVSGIVKVLEGIPSRGFILSKHQLQEADNFPSNFSIHVGDHPIPGENSLRASQALAEFIKSFTTRDLVICAISGGGSSLMTLPVGEITLQDIQDMTRLLLSCGATIDEINICRKHLDQMKGGGLAKLIYPADLITLILSDVIGSPLETIASGPTVPDPSTFADALNVFYKYSLLKRIPASIVHYFQKNINSQVNETPKPGDELFSSVRNVLIGDNRFACEAAQKRATALGYQSIILTTYLKGEARTVGEFLSGILKESSVSNHPLKKPFCLICGGETTVTVKGKGLGGRNQELALGCVKEVSGLERVALIALATDGEDGPTNAAGAFVTGETYAQALAKNLSIDQALAENDAYHFFEKLGKLLRIGPTGTNVNDITFLFSW